MQKGLIVHALIFNDKGEILIMQRSKLNDVLSEFWDIPGGTLKDGEDPADGAIRETKEESGIELSHPKLFFQKANVDTGKNKQFVTLVFRASCSSTEVTLNPEEHQEYKWIRPEEISDYKVVNYMEDCIAAYLELKNEVIP